MTAAGLVKSQAILDHAVRVKEVTAKMLTVDRIPSPLGELVLALDGADLCALDYAGSEERMLKLLSRRYGPVHLRYPNVRSEAGERVQAYFRGDLQAIDGISVRTGGTPFQRQVWAALRAIPPGAPISYGTLAAQLGKPNAARAVGLTNGLNPIAIVVPCHRLIGAHARLTGYAGGLERKRWLLQHEGFDSVAPNTTAWRSRSR